MATACARRARRVALDRRGGDPRPRAARLHPQPGERGGLLSSDAVQPRSQYRTPTMSPIEQGKVLQLDLETSEHFRRAFEGLEKLNQLDPVRADRQFELLASFVHEFRLSIAVGCTKIEEN